MSLVDGEGINFADFPLIPHLSHDMERFPSMTASSPRCLPAETASRKEIPGYSLLQNEFRNSPCPYFLWDLGLLAPFPQFCWDRSRWEWILLFWQEDPATLKSDPWKREQVFSSRARPLQLGRAWFPSCGITPAWQCPRGHRNISLCLPILLMKIGRNRVGLLVFFWILVTAPIPDMVEPGF